ncbi:hypothetical protein BpHYR1_026275 [Brachionus plicatilis]|uniref:Uncharacterized protein n=1 Tax=Brachionus plicatilis TaxID=10195 RepID=A0A3M7QX22_BRAPC|nr:hypothetical protein BpHYR1_026275 [Brachionus plicatilis]
MNNKSRLIKEFNIYLLGVFVHKRLYQRLQIIMKCLSLLPSSSINDIKFFDLTLKKFLNKILSKTVRILLAFKLLQTGVCCVLEN